MPKILLTGGAGFIGSAMAQKLAEDPENRVVIVDDLSTGSLQKIPTSTHKNVRFIKSNVNVFEDISGVFFAGHFDYVFHYAATVGVQRTLDNPVQVLSDIDGIRNVLNLSKNTGVKKVFFASSSEVYGEPFEIPQNEQTTPLNSRLPYAIVKNVGESYLRAYHKEYNLDYTIFRLFNTYGDGQSQDFVMSRFVKAALANEPLYVYGEGDQTRTFCHISDNVDTCVKVFRENLQNNDVINIGTNDEIQIVDLAKMVISITRSDSKIIHLPPLEEGDMKRRCPDNSKMKTVLGRDMMPLHEGIQLVVEAYKKSTHVRD
jgi:UDP-glucuronate decarboxylase